MFHVSFPTGPRNNAASDNSLAKGQEEMVVFTTSHNRYTRVVQRGTRSIITKKIGINQKLDDIIHIIGGTVVLAIEGYCMGFVWILYRYLIVFIWILCWLCAGKVDFNVLYV